MKNNDQNELRQSIQMLFGDKVTKMNGLETATNREKKMIIQKTLG
jgi:hypothetical protein